ncbi:MAG: DUF4381 domain-containing protein [Gammaproteobacteria bacterium]|nr:DUF4381 domain-containing protein [Gammaproteobacteria bacterium]
MNGAETLSQLRDIQLPPPVSAWPPAPGWWLLGLLVLALSAVALRWLWRRRRGRLAANQALKELAAIEARYASCGDRRALASELSVLLRRTALAYHRDPIVAGLTGEDWLAFLDAQGGAGRFAEGPGRYLVEAPYRPDLEWDAPALLTLVRQWLRHTRREAARHV